MSKSYIYRWDANDNQLGLAVWRAFITYDTTELIALLRDCNVVVRTTAAQHLHLRGGKPAFEAARELARDDTPERRALAAFLLGQLGTPDRPFLRKSYPILDALMEDPDAQVRACAIRAFGWLSMDGRRPPMSLLAKVVTFASDPSPMLREAVTDAMGTIKGPEARTVLEHLARDKHKSVRRSAKFWLEDRVN